MLSEFAIRQNPRGGKAALIKNAAARQRRALGLNSQPVLPNLNNPTAASGQNTPPSQAQMNQAAQMKGQAKRVYNQTVQQGNPPPAATVTPQGKAAQKHAQQNHKKRLDAQDLRDKYANNKTPLVAPAINYVANKIIDKFGGNENAVVGTLAAITAAPAVAGGFLYANHKSKEAEKKKQEQAQGHRDKVAEIIARRNLIREERGIDPDSLQAQQAEKNRLELEERKFDFEQKKLKANQKPESNELQPQLSHNYFNAPNKQSEFMFGSKPKPSLDWKKAAAIGVGGYGLLAGLNKKRNEDALKINKIKDKAERAAALDYYNSLQYNVDNVITNVPTALGLSNVVPDTLAHPLVAPAPTTSEEDKKKNKPRWTNYRTQAAYSQHTPKQSADFFLPLVAPVIGIAGAGYGLYRKKKEAEKKDEILQAEKLAALDRIKDKELRAGLLSKARGQLIDDTSRSQLVDSALSGDYKTALGIGLKKINFDSK
jgi:hypothetical protein